MQISLSGRADARKPTARLAVIPIGLEERRTHNGHAREIPGDDVTAIPEREQVLVAIYDNDRVARHDRHDLLSKVKWRSGNEKDLSEIQKGKTQGESHVAERGWRIESVSRRRFQRLGQGRGEVRESVGQVVEGVTGGEWENA